MLATKPARVYVRPWGSCVSDAPCTCNANAINNGCAAATRIGERGGIRLGTLCTSLRSLCLPACDKLTPLVLEAIAQGCTRLVRLNVGHTGAPVVGIFEFRRGCDCLNLAALYHRCYGDR